MNVIHSKPSPKPRRAASGIMAHAIGIRLGMAVFGACVLAVVCSVSPAMAVRGRILTGTFGSAGSGAGQLLLTPQEEGATGQNAGSGLAVNQATHDVYVADTGNHRVDEFSAEGGFIRAWGWGVATGAAEWQTCAAVCRQGISGTAPGQFEAPASIAIDNSAGPSNGDVYVADNDNTLQKFTSGGALIESWGNKGQLDGVSQSSGTVAFNRTAGIAVNSAGDLWVGAESNKLYELNESGTLIGEGEFSPTPSGFAIDESDNLYTTGYGNKIVFKFNPTGVNLGPVFVNEENQATGLALNLANGELYADYGESIDVIPASCLSEIKRSCSASGDFGSPQLKGGVGLAVDSEANVVYATDTAFDRVDAFGLEPPSAPKVESESVSEVGSASAAFQAEIDTHGATTSYRFEYGPCLTPTTCATSPLEASAPVPDAVAGSDFEVHSVTAQPRNLLPDTLYHYRVVAYNEIDGEIKTVDGEDLTFTTQGPGSFGLPDGRAWEIVSPPDKRGGEPFPVFEEGSVVQASASGDAFTFIVNVPSEYETAGFTNYVQVLSRRSSDGWASSDIAIPHEVATGVTPGVGGEYRLFSTDLSLGVVQPFGSFDAKLSPEASEQTPYLRSDYPAGDVESPCVASCYRPLVTGAPGYEDVPSETVFAVGCELSAFCGPTFVGASPDLSHIVLSSEIALTEGAAIDKGSNLLYEWSAGKLALASVLPDGKPAPANGGVALGFKNHVTRNAVSTDGSRIVWSEENGNLYVRDMVRGETVQVGGGGQSPMFQTANDDVSKIFFTQEGNLNECAIVEKEGKLQCEISNLTPTAAGENAGVEGLVAGASEDGSYVYFAANGLLLNDGVAVSGAKSENCNSHATGLCNLYVNHDGVIKLVATLSSKEDIDDWTGLGGGANLPELKVRVSPNGQWLTFMSDRPLTGYDNRDSVTGKPDAEVYLYDASANGGEGQLVCASCNGTGGRPHGRTVESGERSYYQSVAASVPGWTPYQLGTSLYQPRYLADSGRLFFDSYDALVPQDSNGTGDVYEYEPSGAGNCTTSSVTFAQLTGGCTGLISSGTSKEPSVFMDASENGDDVFFLTKAQLVHADTDKVADIYDARVGGGIAEPPSPPVCEGDACQSPVSAPEDPTPGSLTYSGPANPINFSPATTVPKQKAKPLTQAQQLAKALAACKRDKSKHTRSKCEQSARKRYGKAKTGRTTTKKGNR
jgi:NHL repeat/WD40-like Beta Propeller Repeat